MSVLSWNCRGLGNPRTVRELCRLVKEKRPMMVFLMETKLSNFRFDSIKNKIGYGGLFVVNSVGRGGGLAFFGKKKVLCYHPKL
jgi:exonuclease III